MRLVGAMADGGIRSGLRPVAHPRLPRLVKRVGLASDEVRTFARKGGAGEEEGEGWLVVARSDAGTLLRGLPNEFDLWSN